MFKKKNKIEEETVKKMGIYLIVAAVIFITILLIYCIYMIILVKGINERVSNTIEIKANSVIQNNEFTEITINSESYYLKDMCSEGCYFKFNLDEETYYYVIAKENDTYNLSIYNLFKRVDTIDLGVNIDSLNANYYEDYVLFKNIQDDNTSKTDEYIFFNGIKTDIFESNSTNEIELDGTKVSYYAIACKPEENLGAYKIKYQRNIFDSQATILSIEDTKNSKC